MVKIEGGYNWDWLQSGDDCMIKFLVPMAPIKLRKITRRKQCLQHLFTKWLTKIRFPVAPPRAKMTAIHEFQ